MARIARVMGEVEIAVKIREDGSVESAAVVLSASPLLNGAALDSARQSQFECKQCDQATTPYVLTYHFEITPRDPPKDCNEPGPAPPPALVDALKHQVTVSTWPMYTCDPAGELIKVRSAKCLYLWKCGLRYPL
jgi:TonB family protein